MSAKKKNPTAIKRPSKAKAQSGINFLDSNRLSQLLVYSLLAVLLIFVLYVRIRLLTFPLERDEGEYALMGQLILKGIPPYEMAYNMKLPGTYYLYAAIMSLFGQSTIGIHIGLLLFNLTGIILLFILGKKLGNSVLGVMAAVGFGFLSLMPNHLGFAAHATQLMVPFILGGFLCLLQYEKQRSIVYLLVSGFLFGIAFIIKQHALFLLLFGLVSLILIEWKNKPVNYRLLSIHVILMGAAMVLPYVLVVLTAIMNGTFDSFWHWTYEYAGEYISISTMEEIISNFSRELYSATFGVKWLWIWGALGIIALFFSKTMRPYRWIVFLFILSSWATVIPGFYFRPHYFVLFLPALGLLVGITIVFIQELLLKQGRGWLLAIPFILFGLGMRYTIGMYTQYLFLRSPIQLCDVVYLNENPFSISMDIADYIKEHTTESDTIAVIGSEPQIYFYSNRLPATGFIYTYPLAETQPYSAEMQKEMIAEIERVKPKYVVLVNSTFSWGKSFDTVKNLLDWYLKFIQQYETVGVIDLNPGEPAVYYWDEAVKTYVQKSKSSVWISRLKEN